ncbi:hypothetical protein MPSEU_000987700 [Mayamaea pseudoterrestris]|nr:hypothetical protein MPSEU_000987700 [Mayamaea pseudoterrestris]
MSNTAGATTDGRKSVSELKRWLERFGERNQQHFQVNQVGVRRARSIQRRIEKFENRCKGDKEIVVAASSSFDKTLRVSRSGAELVKVVSLSGSDDEQCATAPLVEDKPLVSVIEPTPNTDADSIGNAIPKEPLVKQIEPDTCNPVKTELTQDPVESFDEMYTSSLEAFEETCSSAESEVEVFEQEEAIETVSTKPVFRDFSNFKFRSTVLQCASSDDDCDDEPTYSSNVRATTKEASVHKHKHQNYMVVGSEGSSFAAQPRSWEELDVFPSHSWEEEEDEYDKAPKWHPNALPQVLHDKRTSDLIGDLAFDGFEDASSVGVRQGANVGSFRKFTDGAKTLVGRRHKSTRAMTEKSSSTNPPVATSTIHRRIPRLLGKAGKNQGASSTIGSESSQPITPSPAPSELAPLVTTSMYNATICPSDLLTSSSLEYLCNGTYPSNDAASHSSLEQDSNTVSTWSEDSALPSILPDALDYSMSRMFASSSSQENEHPALTISDHDQYGYSNRTRRRKDLPPPILEVSTMEEADDTSVRACHSQEESNRPNLGELVLKSSSFPNLMPSDKRSTNAVTLTVVAENGTVSDAVCKPKTLAAAHSFDSPERDQENNKPFSQVQKVKIVLEQQWAAAKEPVHVKKVQWALDRKTGGYKKKIVLI